MNKNRYSQSSSLLMMGLMLILINRLQQLPIVRAATFTPCDNKDYRFFKYYYDSSFDINAVAIDQDTSLNYYICGDISNSLSYYMKVNEEGIFTDTNYNYVLSSHSSICKDLVMPKYPASQNYYYIAGEITVTIAGTTASNFYIAKITTNSGALIWFKHYGGQQTESMSQIMMDRYATYVYMIGTTNSDQDANGGNDLNNDIYIAKFKTSDGTLANFKRQGCLGQDMGQSLTFDRFNSTIFTLSASNCVKPSALGSNTMEYALSKLDSNLNTLWSKYYATQYEEQPKLIITNPVSDFLLMIGQSRKSSGYLSPTLVYVNYYGTRQFVRQIGGATQNDQFKDGLFTPDGKFFIVIGQFYSAEMRPYVPVSGIQYPYLTMFKIQLVADNNPQIVLMRQLNYESYVIPSSLFIDMKNNVLITGKLNRKGVARQSSFVMKFQSSLSDWGCIAQNDISAYFLSEQQTWYDDFYPVKFETYDSTFVEEVSRAIILLYDITSSLSYTTLFGSKWFNFDSPVGTCAVNYLVVPDQGLYYYYGKVNSILDIRYKTFEYCFDQSQDASLYQVGMAHLMSGLPPGLIQYTAGGLISGTPTAVGTYDLVFVSRFTDASLTIEAQSIISIKIIGNIGPTVVQNFLMVPETTRVLYPYTYTFNIEDFFNMNGKVLLDVTPKVQSLTGPLLDTVLISSLPSWLNFNSQNLSFYGVPQKSDYPNANQDFPIEIQIYLEVTDSDLQLIKSSIAYLYITNNDPYVNNDITFPSKYCVPYNSTGSQFYYKLPIDTFKDDDQHALYYTLVDQGGTASSTGNFIYYDERSNAIYGVPVSSKIYYMVYSATDLFASVSVDFMIVVSQPSYYAATICSNVRSINIQKPATVTLVNYRECLVDIDSDLYFTARLNNGSSLPNFMSINYQTGVLRIDTSDSYSTAFGYFGILVTAIDDQSCFEISQETNIFINTPILLKNESEIYRYSLFTDRYFITQLNFSDYFVDDDLQYGDNVTLTTQLNINCTWLSYIDLSQSFYGFPTTSDISKQCIVKLTATDLLGSTIDTYLYFDIVQIQPSFYFNTDSLNNFVESDTYFMIEFDKELVLNSANRQITLSYSMKNQSEIMPEWLQTQGSSVRGQAPNNTNINITYQIIIYGFDEDQNQDNMYLNLTVGPRYFYKKSQGSNLRYQIIRNEYFQFDFKELIHTELENMESLDVLVLNQTQTNFTQYLPLNISEIQYDWLEFNQRNYTLFGFCCGILNTTQSLVYLQLIQKSLTQSMLVTNITLNVLKPVPYNDLDAKDFQAFLLAFTGFWFIFMLILSQIFFVPKLDQISIHERYLMVKKKIKVNGQSRASSRVSQRQRSSSSSRNHNSAINRNIHSESNIDLKSGDGIIEFQPPSTFIEGHSEFMEQTNRQDQLGISRNITSDHILQ